MWRTYWLSAIAVALAITIPNVVKLSFAHGIFASVLVLLVYFAAYSLAIRRACGGRNRGILSAAFLAGLDVSAIAAPLVCVFHLGSRLYSNPRPAALRFIWMNVVVWIIGTIIVGIIFSFIIGTAILIKRSAASDKIVGTVEAPLPSIFAGRRLISFVPHAACVAILLLAVFAGIFSARPDRQPNRKMEDILNAGPKIGAPAPNEATATLDGRPWRIADHFGKVVVIDFWATWCKPCIASFPMLQRVQKKYGDRKDFVIVGVSVDSDRSDLDKFLANHKMDWPILFDNGKDNKLAEQFDVNAIPSLWIVDKSGHIAAKNVFAEEQLDSKISGLLAEAPIASDVAGFPAKQPSPQVGNNPSRTSDIIR
jgi:thiol-disulfide isomerase/thioredoxin